MLLSITSGMHLDCHQFIRVHTGVNLTDIWIRIKWFNADFQIIREMFTVLTQLGALKLTSVTKIKKKMSEIKLIPCQIFPFCSEVREK